MTNTPRGETPPRHDALRARLHALSEHVERTIEGPAGIRVLTPFTAL